MNSSREGRCATLVVRAHPSARSSAVLGWGRDAQGRAVLEVALAAPARDDAANRELRRLMAEVLHCARSEIELVAGSASRLKRLEVPLDYLARLPPPVA